MSKTKPLSLDYLRMLYVDNLRIAMQKLRDTADKSLKKIDDQGISGYYSCNSDVHRYASEAWRASWALCELRILDEGLNKEVQARVEQKLESMLNEHRKNDKQKSAEE